MRGQSRRMDVGAYAHSGCGYATVGSEAVTLGVKPRHCFCPYLCQSDGLSGLWSRGDGAAD